MRRFHLVRTKDITGVSGTGLVAEGVEFTDGTAVLRWKATDRPQSTVTYASVSDLISIHDHKNTEHEHTTEIMWLDT